MSTQLQFERNRIVSQMEKMIANSEESKKPFTPEEKQAYARMRDDVKDLTETINAASETQKLAQELALPSNTGKVITAGGTVASADSKSGDPEYKSLFNRYARYGVENLDGGEIKTLRSKLVRFTNSAQTTSGSGGGYLIPVELSNKIEVRMKYFGGMLQAAETFSTSGGYVFNFPTLDDVSNSGEAHSVNGAVNSQALAFGNVAFSSFTYDTGSILVPFELLEDSAFDLDNLIVEAFAIRLGRKINNKLTVGSGSGEPTGLITALVANSNTVTATQNSSAVASSGNPFVYADLVKMKHSVDKAYRDMPSVGWMAHDTAYEALELLEDSNGRPLLRSSLEGFGDTDDVVEKILGKKVFVNNDIAAPTGFNGVSYTAATPILAFGDFSKYKIREIADNSGSKFSMIRLNELYAANLQKGYIGWKRIDGQLVVAGSSAPAAITVLTQA